MSGETSPLYFPVENVTLEDLFDWSNNNSQCKTTTVSVRALRRQSSQTGSVAEVNEVKVALFRYGEKVFAINERCPHAGGPLHVGDIEVLPDRNMICVRCPWHSWKFDLETGNAVYPPGRDIKASVYPVKVSENGTIHVGFSEFAQNCFNGNIDF